MADSQLTSNPEDRFADPALEEQYDQERRALLEPAQAVNGGALLVLTLAVFVLTQLRSDGSAWKLAILVAVLLFHELGHYAGMRIFGYRDVRMFFIPFLGAAVSGRRESAPAWKEAVVLLLGPIPGILLGILFVVWNLRSPDPLKKDAMITLLVVNGFNLLPLGGLDGAKLFQRVVFSRNRFLELGFLAVAAAGLGVVALFARSWALGVFAALGVIALPYRYRVLGVVRDLRLKGIALPPSPARLEDRPGRALFLAARAALPDRARTRAKAVANTMREVIDSAQPAPGLAGSSLLLGGWLFGLIVSLGAGMLVAAQSLPERWQRYDVAGSGFTAEYPHEPARFSRLQKTPWGQLESWSVMASQDMLHKFTVQYYDAPGPLDAAETTRWMDQRLAELAGEVSARIVAEGAESDGARLARLSNGRRTWRVKLLARGKRLYTVTTSSPDAGPDGDRFLASFALVPE
jgi:Zn-dependent protease